MGQRGPKQTPLKVLSARGSWRAKVRSEPDVEAGAPAMPDGLTELEARVWREVCDLLVPLGVVTVGDGLALRMLVDSIRAWEAARADGDERAIRDARQDVGRWLARFGLSPADRTNVGGGSKPAGGDKSSYFQMKA